MSEQLIFVYGTLKRGHRNSFALKNERHIGEAVTKPYYRLYDLGRYPGLVQELPGTSIYGELWCVSQNCLQRLDEIEAVDEGLYTRDHVVLASHPELQVETYFYAHNIDVALECGPVWNGE